MTVLDNDSALDQAILDQLYAAVGITDPATVVGVHIHIIPTRQLYVTIDRAVPAWDDAPGVVEIETLQYTPPQTSALAALLNA